MCFKKIGGVVFGFVFFWGCFIGFGSVLGFVFGFVSCVLVNLDWNVRRKTSRWSLLNFAFFFGGEAGGDLCF